LANERRGRESGREEGEKGARNPDYAALTRQGRKRRKKHFASAPFRVAFPP